MVFHYLPLVEFAPADFSRDRSAASSADTIARIPCLVRPASQPHAWAAVGVPARRSHFPASGIFVRRLNTPASSADEDRPEGR